MHREVIIGEFLLIYPVGTYTIRGTTETTHHLPYSTPYSNDHRVFSTHSSSFFPTAQCPLIYTSG